MMRVVHTRSKWIRAALLSLGLTPIAVTLHAEDTQLCDRVAKFVSEASALSVNSKEVIIDLPTHFSTKGECGASTFMSGVRSAHCAWSFSYRSRDATQAFQSLSQSLATCGDLVVPKKAAKGVNHPDSFEQHLFKVDGGYVSVSLKDKGALQQTYVFLRTQSRLEN